jgi:deoxyribonuclease V
MTANHLHGWRTSVGEAIALQNRLRDLVRLEPLSAAPRLVAGADVAYSSRTGRMYAAAAVVSLPRLDLVEVSRADRAESFPYIPGLFAFRELPVLIAALETLRSDPDVILFDGHGIAHPRRFGLASHAGVLLARPTIGCAKCLLVGRYAGISDERGTSVSLHADDGQVVEAAVRTRSGVMPVFVSPGHLVDLASSVRIVLAASGRYRTPEPLRQAHLAAVQFRQRVDPDHATREGVELDDFVAG